MNTLIAVTDYAFAAALKIASYFYKVPKYGHRLNVKTIIFIPGVYETPLYFRKLEKMLTKDYSIVHSQSIYGKESDTELNARSIASYIDENDLVNVTLIGHSSGGLCAVKSTLHTVNITKVLTIAAPFHGVLNGHVLRTTSVKELLPRSTTIQSFKNLPFATLQKTISIYPSFDNQVWSKKGSYLEGAKNIKIRAKGHHLVLRSNALLNAIKTEL